MNKFSYTKSDLAHLMPERPQNSHKGTFGRVLAVGGAPCMAGAPCLAAKAAYRVGAGLVEILTHTQNRTIAQTLVPEAVLSLYGDRTDNTEKILASLARADAVAVGMGLSESEEAREILTLVLRHRTCPAVIDADAINIISKNKELRALLREDDVITPHPLEASRLSGMSVAEITSDIPESAKKIADEIGVICLLKSHRTAVASPDAAEIYVNMSGNSGMSTGGSGDVLSGIIAGLLAEGKSSREAAQMGAYLHGLAGDVAAESLSEYSVMAGDIADSLPRAILDVLNNK